MSLPRYRTEIPAEATTDCRSRPVVFHVVPDGAAGEPSIETHGLVLPDEDFTMESVPEISCDWQALVDALRAAGAEIR